MTDAEPTVDELRAILAAGGGLILDARQHMPEDLRRLAGAAAAALVLTGAASLAADDRRRIAAAGGNHVIFDFTR